MTRECKSGERKILGRVCIPNSAKTFEEGNELIYIKAGWSDATYQDAKSLRNESARELRKLTYDVKSKTFDFTDLSRSIRYELEATKKGWEFKSMGGWRKIL